MRGIVYSVTVLWRERSAWDHDARLARRQLPTPSTKSAAPTTAARA